MKNPKEILKETFQKFKNRRRLVDDSTSEITLIEKEQTESIISTNETIYQKPTLRELNMTLGEEWRREEPALSIDKIDKIQEFGLKMIVEMKKQKENKIYNSSNHSIIQKSKNENKK
jgi:hypothetical protein